MKRQLRDTVTKYIKIQNLKSELYDKIIIDSLREEKLSFAYTEINNLKEELSQKDKKIQDLKDERDNLQAELSEYE